MELIAKSKMNSSFIVRFVFLRAETVVSSSETRLAANDGEIIFQFISHLENLILVLPSFI